MSTTTPRTPSADALMQSVSLYQQAIAELVDPDEDDEIGRRFHAAGRQTPAQMLETMVDVVVLLDQRAEFMESLMRRYKTKQARLEARAERARQTVRQLMDVTATTAAEGTLGTASYVKPRASVAIVDFAKLPERYIRRPEPEAKKLDIAGAIKRGEAVPGAEMQTPNEPVLRIVEF